MRYKHDCEQCIYLGEFSEQDLYFCEQGGIPTVIARWSDEGGDYNSGIAAAEYIAELKEAKDRAKARGLL